jgi:hypothetical protein
MNNPDVIINGFSHSVIESLIKALQEESVSCFIEAEKIYVNTEKEGLRMFNDKCATRIKMLAKWMLTDTPKEFKSSRELGNFLEDARILLRLLAPSFE